MRIVFLFRSCRQQSRFDIKMGMNTFSRKITLSNCSCLPSRKGSSLKGKYLLPNSFLLEKPFQKRCLGKQARSHTSCLPYYQMWNLPMYYVP